MALSYSSTSPLILRYKKQEFGSLPTAETREYWRISRLVYTVTVCFGDVCYPQWIRLIDLDEDVFALPRLRSQTAKDDIHTLELPLISLLKLIKVICLDDFELLQRHPFWKSFSDDTDNSVPVAVCH